MRVCGKVHWVWVLFSGSMCAEGKCCGKRRVIWELQGTGAASRRPGASWRISPMMRWLSQPAVCSKIGQTECLKRIGGGGYNISVDRTYRHDSLVLCGFNGRRIRERVRENSRSCWRAPSYGTCRSPFANFRVSFCPFFRCLCIAG